MAPTQTQRPPTIAGLPEPRTIDTWRITWWNQIGYLHGARRGHGAGRAFSAVLAIMWWFSLPLLLVVQHGLNRRRSVRYYMSPTKDAVLAVAASRKGWAVQDHVAERPGTGQGRALRALVLPELTKAADAAGMRISATAANKTLAMQYAAELPGLVDVGRGIPRGRKMQRPAQRSPRLSQPKGR